MRFKNWLNETLAGPGGGPGAKADDVEAMARDNARHGAGAFPTYGDEPPPSPESPTQRYLDKRFTRKAMKKRMKKT